jgi:hypothetical protein
MVIFAEGWVTVRELRAQRDATRCRVQMYVLRMRGFSVAHGSRFIVGKQACFLPPGIRRVRWKISFGTSYCA